MRMKSMSKHSDEKYHEIFLTVLGITPQVLTECLYYYYSDYYKQNRKFDSIKVFTTTQGKEKLVDSLFKKNKLKDLEVALGLDKGDIPFTEDSIILYKSPDGTYLSDMRTTEDNEHAQSFLFNQIKSITMDPEIRITATVAGGRKTMSSQMALAFQLYGRRQDELIHILAPEEKMKPGSDWFFPGNPNNPNEQLYVSNIPILRVGRYLTKSMDISPDKLFNKLQDELVSQSSLKRLSIEKNNFYGNNEIFTLPPKPASYLRYMIKRRKESACEIDCQGCEKCFNSTYDLIDRTKNEILKEHEIISGKWSGNLDRTKEGAVDLAVVTEAISRIRTEIRKSKISLSFKESIRIISLSLDDENKKFKSHGVLIDKNIITFKD